MSNTRVDAPQAGWLCAAVWALLLQWSPAAALEPPIAAVVLKVSGNIGEKNGPDAASFDMGMLNQLPQHQFLTRTPWDQQKVSFSGPLLRDVLAATKAAGKRIKAVAVNDYKVTIPLEDTQRFAVILATRMNDKPIPARTKGPLFVVYPFDTDPVLTQGVTYKDRSIWQVKALEVE
jgi:hypothetical protein